MKLQDVSVLTSRIKLSKKVKGKALKKTLLY